MVESHTSKKTILVCLSPSPSCQNLIRTAYKFKTNEDSFLALYIGLNEDVKKDASLGANVDLVKQYNGDVIIIESNDVVSSIVEYARRVGATDIFVGYSAPTYSLFSKTQLGVSLSSYLNDVDIHMIPSAMASDYPKRMRKNPFMFNAKDIFIVIGIMFIATLVSYWFDLSRYSNSNIITIYLLAILLISVLTSHQIYGLIASLLYILLFNFLFIDPRLTFLVYDSAYLMTYFVSILAAFITGSLASRLKEVASSSAQTAYQAKALLDTSNQLERVHERSKMIEITCTQLSNLLNRPIYFYVVENDQIQNIYACDIEEIPCQKEDEIDSKVIQYVYEKKHHAGAFTKQFSDSKKRYYSIHNDHSSFGIIGIDMQEKAFSEFENTILLSILNEFTLSLENSVMAEEKQTALIQSEKANFRSNLLRSISHDLRTPLTTIIGNAENLVHNDQDIEEPKKKKIYQDILEDASWLHRQMENILSMTKVEDSHNLNLKSESLEDIITEALKHVEKSETHTIIVEDIPVDYFVVVDMQLIVLVLVNLINNAIKYTPDGSTIWISCKAENDKIWVDVKDDGLGIKDEDKDKIFELFYTGDKKVADSFRSMGIGLNFCFQTLQAHHQTIMVLDNEPHGAIFRFSLERKDVHHVRV